MAAHEHHLEGAAALTLVVSECDRIAEAINSIADLLGEPIRATATAR